MDRNKQILSVKIQKQDGSKYSNYDEQNLEIGWIKILEL